MAIGLADSLYHTGNYYDAITEYNRYLFFHTDALDQSDIHYKMGLCYKNMGDWDTAIEYIQLSAATAPDNIVRDQRRIDVAIIYTARGNYGMSEFLVTKIGLFAKDRETKRRYLLIATMNYIYTFQWEKARTSYIDYLSFAPNASEEKHFCSVTNLLMEAQGEKLKSERLAKWLSTFIPGLGQIYSNDWRNGVNALALNSATTYFSIDLLWKRSPDAYTVSLFWWRYYAGQRFHAGRIASEKNHQKKLEYQSKILRALRGCLNNHSVSANE